MLLYYYPPIQVDFITQVLLINPRIDPAPWYAPRAQGHIKFQMSNEQNMKESDPPLVAATFHICQGMVFYITRILKAHATKRDAS
ncbi:hypothetical protein ABKN59_001793 [Abortiporus biennis]